MHPMLRHYAYHAIFAAAAASLALLLAGVWAVAAVGEPVWPTFFNGGEEVAWSHSDEISVLALIITATGMFVALYGFAIGRIAVALKHDRIADVQGGGWQLLVPTILALFTCSVLGILLNIAFWLVSVASVWPLLAAWRVAKPFQPPKFD